MESIVSMESTRCASLTHLRDSAQAHCPPAPRCRLTPGDNGTFSTCARGTARRSSGAVKRAEIGCPNAVEGAFKAFHSSLGLLHSSQSTGSSLAAA